MTPTRTPSHRLTFDDATQVWVRWHHGEFHNRIAASFDVNPARIYDVIYEKLHPGSKSKAEKLIGVTITRKPKPRRRNDDPDDGGEPELF